MAVSCWWLGWERQRRWTVAGGCEAEIGERKGAQCFGLIFGGLVK